jgi:hypothetical protein
VSFCITEKDAKLGLQIFTHPSEPATTLDPQHIMGFLLQRDPTGTAGWVGGCQRVCGRMDDCRLRPTVASPSSPHSWDALTVAIGFLEHLVHDRGEQRAKFHNELIYLYLESISPLLSREGEPSFVYHRAGEDPGRLGELRVKLLHFLETSEVRTREGKGRERGTWLVSG